ncbi:MAG: hypothetical protein R3322_16540 [Kiloniellales bacterium]|jgi:hypothetical protein|nr:hypothetical protein [Kiloniellales bacterium]
MRPTVFIHTNHKQMVGALVARYALKRNSPNAERFDVELIDTADHDFLKARDGQFYLRDGARRVWAFDDLQSFTPLRFMPPELMGYQGRAVVMDPDIFAVGDIWELLQRDMKGAAIMCRPRSGSKEKRGHLATSVMLLDCAKLTHWRCAEQFDEMFAFKRDYMDWIGLRLEPRETIALFENEWNDFDRLTPATKLLHNTKRRTQPWKTGLKVDYFPPEKPGGSAMLGWVYRMRRRLFGDYALMGRYRSHPDPNQERFFFGLLRECLDRGIVTEDMLRAEMGRNHVRHDAFEVLDRTPPLAA